MRPLPSNAELLARGRQISRHLRKRRLALEQLGAPITTAPARPDIYYERAPCGKYPIVALRTVPCDLYVRGFCGPCSYSARPYPRGLRRESLHDGLIAQLEWLLDHFDDVVAAHADGTLAGYRLRGTAGHPWYMIQLAGESSFFRDAEVPPSHRRLLLERLCRFRDEHGINLHVMLETRPEHLLEAEKCGELATLAPLLSELNAVVNLGLEAHDDFLRNVVFAKALELPVFERAIAAAHRHALDPGVFVFASTELLTPSEMLAQTRATLDYLHGLGVFVNLMVANLQAYTLSDLLYESGSYELPEPFILLDLVDSLLAYQPIRPHPITPFDWFLGGLVADPLPRATILDHPRRRTSAAVTVEIRHTVSELVRSGNEVAYRSAVERLRSGPEYAAFHRTLLASDPRTWRERWSEALEIAADNLNSYDARVHLPIFGQ